MTTTMTNTPKRLSKGKTFNLTESTISLYIEVFNCSKEEAVYKVKKAPCIGSMYSALCSQKAIIQAQFALLELNEV